jgi:hypothetical protein
MNQLGNTILLNLRLLENWIPLLDCDWPQYIQVSIIPELISNQQGVLNTAQWFPKWTSMID